MSEASSTTNTKSDRYPLLVLSRPGLHKQIGAFPILEKTMTIKRHTKNHAFSMIELVVVISITAIIATIAVPKFADASSGRRLSTASKTLNSDIQWTKIRSRATSKTHVIKFYPSENRYIIVQGTEVKREAIVLTRDFDDDPFNLSIKRTNLTGDLVVVVSPFGDLSPAFTVGLFDQGTEITVEFEGVASLGVTPVVTITDGHAAAADTGIAEAIIK